MHDDLGALIQRADLNQRLTKALEIKGHKSPIRLLSPDVIPTVLVEDLTKQAEWVTPTERRLAATADILGVVGQNGILAVQNPVASGVIGVLSWVTCFAATSAQPFVFGLVNPAAIPATPANLFFLDRRIPGAPTLRAFSGTSATLDIVNPYLWFQASNAISTPQYALEGIVIQPGDAFGVQCNAANLEIRPTIWVQEIPL